MPINFDWFDLQPYANKYFVETGLFHGEGAMKALSSGAFERVISVEVNQDLVDRALERFRLMVATGLLKVVHDDSAHLWDHIRDLEHPITFFLDAHGHWIRECKATTEAPPAAGAAGADADPLAASACPLLEELDAISRHPLARRHTILIDDRRCLQPGWQHPTQAWWRGLSEDAVLGKLREINPDFQISFADGLVPGDIIAAVPPERAPASGAAV
mmetsp:Transcript_5009/g.14645  ORF Transcript_5009/g.14645 Transcript_5009/m.14645 type:complete len:216 (+) Transcript_5009:54-701(+)